MSTPHTPIQGRSSNRAADAIWRRLCEGLNEPWLEDVRSLRGDLDPYETTLDIWTVGLTAELRNPERKETAGIVLTRLQKLAASTEDGAGFDED